MAKSLRSINLHLNLTEQGGLSRTKLLHENWQRNPHMGAGKIFLGRKLTIEQNFFILIIKNSTVLPGAIRQTPCRKLIQIVKY